MPDSAFGYVVACQREEEDFIVLDPVRYGACAAGCLHCMPYPACVVGGRPPKGEKSSGGACLPWRLHTASAGALGRAVVQGGIPGYQQQLSRSWRLCKLRTLCTGADGPFTVSLWFRGNGSDTSGELFEYIFSHSAYATRTLPSPVSSFQANQARLSKALSCIAEPLPFVVSGRVGGDFPARHGSAPSLVSRASMRVRSDLRKRRQQLQGCAQSVSVGLAKT